MKSDENYYKHTQIYNKRTDGNDQWGLSEIPKTKFQ